MPSPSAPTPAPVAQRAPYFTLVCLLVGSRLFILLVAWLSLLIIRKGEFFTPPPTMLDWFLRWDTGWYLSIAETGYGYTPGVQSSVAFFPLYPTAISLLGNLTGGPIIAGYILSNLSLYGALVFLWKWIAHEYADSRLATNACVFLLIGPVSFFFSTLYTESTFLFFAVSCLYFGRTRQWLMAGLLGCCAALTRNIGVFLVPVLLWEFYTAWRESKTSLKAINLLSLACCLIPVLGTFIYMTYLWNAFGDPLAFSRVQSSWDRGLVPFWRVFHPQRVASMEPFYRYWFIGMAAIAALATALGFWLRVRKATLLIIIIPFILYLSTNNLESIPRYLSVLFPLYLIAALLAQKHPLIEKTITVGSLGFLTLSTVLFVNGYWFT